MDLASFFLGFVVGVLVILGASALIASSDFEDPHQ